MSRKSKSRKVVLNKAVDKPFIVKKAIPSNRITITSGIPVIQTISAELNKFNGYTNYTALYDEYKILKVKVHYRVLNPVNIAYASQTTSGGNTTGIVTLGVIHSVVDKNDINTPGSIQQLMNDSSYFVTKTNKDHSRTFTPHFLTNVGGGAQAQSTTGYLSCDSSNISHYGMKTWFEPGEAPAGFTSYIVEPIITYWIAFRNQRN